MIHFLLGGIVAASALLVAEYFFYTKIIKKFSNHRFYSVCDYETTADKTGGYKMTFYLTPDIVLNGYTKKLPPEDTPPEKLKVYVRGYHTKRLAYRVFWEIIRE